MDGVVNALKPPGMTSHDVVAFLRRLFGVRAGHGGTLDPGAAGVLVVCLGKATRLSEFLLEGSKSYRAEAVLGARTATLDAFSPEEPVGDPSFLERKQVEEAVARLMGEIEQVPPMTAALKRGGRPLYRLAREGREVPRPARRVTIFAARLVDFSPGKRARAVVDLTCSHGTYVRSWCAALGEALGVGAYLKFLVRTRVGDFPLEEALTLEELAAARGEPERVVQPLDRVVEHLPAVRMEGKKEQVAAGRLPPEALWLPGGRSPRPGEKVRVLGPDGELWAIARWVAVGTELDLRPLKVLITR